jgi:hypothetical protein
MAPLTPESTLESVMAESLEVRDPALILASISLRPTIGVAVRWSDAVVLSSSAGLLMGLSLKMTGIILVGEEVECGAEPGRRSTARSVL